MSYDGTKVGKFTAKGAEEGNALQEVLGYVTHVMCVINCRTNLFSSDRQQSGPCALDAEGLLQQQYLADWSLSVVTHS